MYFPYFRGKQYELLALRELAQNGLLKGQVIPVVEPIKVSPTYNAVIKLFVDTKQPLAIILNPTAGDLAIPLKIGEVLSSIAGLIAPLVGGLVTALVVRSLARSTADSVIPSIEGSIIPSVIINENAAEAISDLAKQGIQTNNILAIMTKRDFLDTYNDLFNTLPPRFTLFPDERQIRRAIKKNKVMFEDKFKRQEKNVDYLKQKDEFYSDDHLYFRDEGFVGFGDYSIIGDKYADKGFAPYAVAIHIIYFADDDTLRVRHFVSDSNTDIEDVAGKYYEAVTKLKRWYDDGQSRQRTTALSTLLSHAENGYYPGLPTIKKLSIMHHLELVAKYLDTLDRGIPR